MQLRSQNKRGILWDRKEIKMKKEIPFLVNLLLIGVVGYTISKMGYGLNSIYTWILFFCVCGLFKLGQIYESNKVK